MRAPPPKWDRPPKVPVKTLMLLSFGGSSARGGTAPQDFQCCLKGSNDFESFVCQRTSRRLTYTFLIKMIKYNLFIIHNIRSVLSRFDAGARAFRLWSCRLFHLHLYTGSEAVGWLLASFALQLLVSAARASSVPWDCDVIDCRGGTFSR